MQSQLQHEYDLLFAQQTLPLTAEERKSKETEARDVDLHDRKLFEVIRAMNHYAAGVATLADLHLIKSRTSGIEVTAEDHIRARRMAATATLNHVDEIYHRQRSVPV